ncbi:C-C chemokine receptor type 7 [Lithobates pipiens]
MPLLRNREMLQKFSIAFLVLISVQICAGQQNDTIIAEDIGQENDTVTPEDADSNFTPDYNGYEQVCVKADVRGFRAIFLPIIYACIFVIGLVGNGLVMLRYVYFNRLKTGTDFYMLNLALADMVFLFTLPFWAASIVQTWIFGNDMCKVIYCLYKMSFFSGMFILMSVSIERYFVIVLATSAHRHRSKTVLVSKLSSAGIWVGAFFLSIPELIYSGVKPINDENTCVIFVAEFRSLGAGLKISQMVIGFLLPLIIMVFCYSMIIMTLLRVRNFEKYKAIKVIIAIVIVFLVFQLPYNSVMLIKTFDNSTDCDISKTIDVADDVTYSLACFRCVLNPFLYVIIGVKFRNDLCKFFKDLGCLSQEKFTEWSTAKPSKRGSFAMDTDTTTTFSP